MLLYLVWQMWWNNSLAANQQSQSAGSLTAEWAQKAAPTTAGAAPIFPSDRNQSIPVLGSQNVPNAQRLAVVYVPRFGPNSERTVAEGVGLDVLDSWASGVGHYPGTTMPGGVGNFAIAGHRSGNGAPFADIVDLQIGDAIYVQTQDGWYTYRYRDTQYVLPADGNVVGPVPNLPNNTPTERFITLTSCNPVWSDKERVIAHGTLESFQPGANNPPTAIAADVAAWR